MQKIILGQNGPEVSSVGLGCMGMSEFYGGTDDENSKQVILSALENGVTMIDTADTYGDGHNERLISGVIKKWGNRVCIATKFGIVRKLGSYEREICGRPQYVRQAVEKSLKRLDIETIDLYYIHRIDTTVPIEDTVGAMSELVREGKIKYLGLSEASVKTVLKAHAVHPISCVQSEYSLFTRDVEDFLLPALRKNGIGFVSYSPLGRGLLTGKLTKESMEHDGDLRKYLPRTSVENFDTNMSLVNALKKIADSKEITLSQLALAWILSKGDDIVPIPGTRNVKYLMDNINAAKVHLNDDDIKEIETIVYPDAVKGERYTSEGMKGVNC
ncbi:aldo/keto reductase [Desulfospira joergensenii]|uniref:aldo/keto reductase n=1 Tax=Desulfospira joergensenii TaxID=53329 RepID=UPI0003B31C9B|nr:aldo/keto reductase [Desulfospira joergensenii]